MMDEWLEPNGIASMNGIIDPVKRNESLSPSALLGYKKKTETSWCYLNRLPVCPRLFFFQNYEEIHVV